MSLSSPNLTFGLDFLQVGGDNHTLDLFKLEMLGDLP